MISVSPFFSKGEACLWVKFTTSEAAEIARKKCHGGVLSHADPKTACCIHYLPQIDEINGDSAGLTTEDNDIVDQDSHDKIAENEKSTSAAGDKDVPGNKYAFHGPTTRG